VVTAAAAGSVNENAQLSLTITAADPDGQAITSLTANLANLPAGHNAVFTANASKTSGTLTWTPKFVDGRVAPYNVTFTATNALSGSATTAITVNNVDRAPVVTAAPTAAATIGTQLTFNITAADSDGDAITNLTANLASLPAGNNAVFTANGTKTGGTLTWTPQAGTPAGPFTVSFTAQNALSGSASTAISVQAAGGGNLVTNPGFETDLSGWASNGPSTLTRVAGGHSGGFCLQAANASTGTFGITDSPNTVPSVTAVGITYHLTAWVRSAAAHGAGKIKVREFVGSTQQGSSTYSNPVTLSTTWQLITIDYVTRTAGSFLDVEVNDYPVASSETIQIDDVSITKVGSEPAPPLAQQLVAVTPLAFAAHPSSNPLPPGGELRFSTTRAGGVRVEVFDLQGRLVSRPLDEPFVAAGRHAVHPFAGAARPGAGLYFYRLRADEGVRFGSFVLLQ
jgi:hypothetical protein